jgi:hypothetical protein
MISFIKYILATPLRIYYKLNPDAWRIKNWENNGRQGHAPHALKFKAIRDNAKKYHPAIFIETGTYMGDMVDKVKALFPQVISIELDIALHAKAVERFKAHPHITIMQGDSGQVLASLMQTLDKTCLFWLDGHFSEGVTAKGELITPIVKELENIAANAAKTGNKHVIIVDDARLFNGTDDYPTIETMQQLQQKLFPGFSFKIENDAILILP